MGTIFDAMSSFSSALASPHGCPAICAPLASAWYSRERETASWIRVAAIGASTTMSRPPSAPPAPESWSSLSRRPPPKIIAHCAMWAR